MYSMQQVFLIFLCNFPIIYLAQMYCNGKKNLLIPSIIFPFSYGLTKWMQPIEHSQKIISAATQLYSQVLESPEFIYL